MNLEKDCPYRMILASRIKPLISEERDKYLAKASLDEIKKFIPDIPTDSIDLLPFAGEGFNVNKANKNYDAIDTETALDIYKNFILRYVDLEHKRQNCVGVILTASLAEYGTGKPITESEAEKLGDKPFNVIIGGVIWRIVSPKLAELVEESGDPDSDYYKKISCSWEIGFKNFKLALLDQDTSSNIEGAKIITEEEAAIWLLEN